MFSKRRVRIVTPSNWLAERAASSEVLQGYPISVIPNAINTTVFKPVDKHLARAALNLDPESSIVLFGAHNPEKDPVKGLSFLRDALSQMRDYSLDIVVFGMERPAQPLFTGHREIYLGMLHDDLSLSLAYSAADACVVPSRIENLSYVIIESLSCGTPVVCFDVGGNHEIVDHRDNGYLARPFEAWDLANGIKEVLYGEDKERLSTRARQKAVAGFSSELVARQYWDLYSSVV